MRFWFFVAMSLLLCHVQCGSMRYQETCRDRTVIAFGDSISTSEDDGQRCSVSIIVAYHNSDNCIVVWLYQHVA